MEPLSSGQIPPAELRSGAYAEPGASEGKGA